MYSGLAATLTAAALISSYNIPLKARVFRPFGPGRRRFSRGQVCMRRPDLARTVPGACDGRYFLFPPERAAVRPLHAKAFYVIHRVAEDNDLLWNVMNREIKTVK